MSSCERIRPALSRVAEGEAAPDEAMRAARHLSDCTACRILLARERRLAEMLEADLPDRLSVGEDFVRSVMDNLPSEPPPRPRSRARRRLRLAGLAGMLAAAPLLGARLWSVTDSSSAAATLPRLEVPGLEGGPEALLGVGRLLHAAAGVVLSWVPAIGRALPAGPELALLVALPFVAGMTAIALIAAVATPSLIRKAGP